MYMRKYLFPTFKTTYKIHSNYNHVLSTHYGYFQMFLLIDIAH